jgi:RNA polymerase primary sigma factor
VDGLSRYLEKIGDHINLDKDEEKGLTEIMRGGGPEAENAKNVMIAANLRLVVAIAKEHQKRGLLLEDLIAEGNIGLIKAIERFDPEQGNKLSTYACWWIKQCIHQAICEQSKTIKMPPHASEKLRRVKQIMSTMNAETGKAPTVEELSAETSISIKKLEEILRWEVKPLSLNHQEEDSSAPMEAFIEDEKAVDPAIGLLKKSDAQWIYKLLEECLNKREQEIIKKRYGIGIGKEATLEDIGKDLGITRERVRQIASKAMRKLRKKSSQIESLEN